MPSDSEEEQLEEIEDEVEEEHEQYIDEDLPEVIADDMTEEGDDESASYDSEDGTEEDEDGEAISAPKITMEATKQPKPVLSLKSNSIQASSVSRHQEDVSKSSSQKSLSPAELRNRNLRQSRFGPVTPRSYTVEAVCALPHPVPTHCLAASQCMSYLLTGSDDGYIRNYDIFSSLNGKNFLTAPQRHHSNVVEGIMKSGVLRFWWENPGVTLKPSLEGTEEDEQPLASVHSLTMQSDGLWCISGSDIGSLNIFTVRHSPGTLCHTISAHKGPVSALCLDQAEKAVFSAGWDGDAIQWDLNTGHEARRFVSHGAQLTSIAVRPENVLHSPANANLTEDTNNSRTERDIIDADTRSDASFDPLFDEDEHGLGPMPSKSSAAPKNAPSLLDPATYSTFSPDTLITASIDGQVIIWDRRINATGSGVGRLWISDKTPPWCLSACWSADGNHIYVGRRNGTIDVWDVRLAGRSGPSNTPRLLKVLRNPVSSGVVSCVVAFPDSKHIASASVDNIRLWNVYDAPDTEIRGKGVPFKIIPGHHGGYISQMLIDPGSRFLVTSSSNRGWHGESTRTVFVHDIKPVV